MVRVLSERLIWFVILIKIIDKICTFVKILIDI